MVEGLLGAAAAAVPMQTAPARALQAAALTWGTWLLIRVLRKEAALLWLPLRGLQSAVVEQTTSVSTDTAWLRLATGK